MKPQKGFVLLQTSIALILIVYLVTLTHGYSKKIARSTLRFTKSIHANVQLAGMEKLIKYVLSQTNFGYFNELTGNKSKSQFTGTLSLFNDTVVYQGSTASNCVNLRALTSEDPDTQARAQQLLSNLTEDLFGDPEKGRHISALISHHSADQLSLKKIYSLLETESSGDLSKLKPYLCYLPFENQCLDINSMDEDTLPTLYAFLAPHVTKESVVEEYAKIANIGYIKQVATFLNHFVPPESQPEHLKKEFNAFAKFFKLTLQFTSTTSNSLVCDVLIYRNSPTEGFSSVYKVCE